MNRTNKSEGTTATHPVKSLCSSRTRTTAGREGGALRTSTGRRHTTLSVPGSPGIGPKAEQLFVVGWAGCFLSALNHVTSRIRDYNYRSYRG